MSRKIPNASEMGRKGGKKRFEKIGSKGMAELAKKGRETIRQNNPDFYKNVLAQAGVEGRRKKKELRLKEEQEKKSSVNKLSKLLSGS
jgi:hypothetical protein